MDFDSFFSLVSGSRSIRRFQHDKPVDRNILRNLIRLARLTPSSKNQQPLKYILLNESGRCDDVFSCLNWAKALSSWGGPAESERPAGYILILGDSSLISNPPSKVGAKYSVDPGIVAQTMRLGAATFGLGGCIIASIDRDRLRSLLHIDSRYDIILMLALGYPSEEVMTEPMPESGETKYWRDDNEVHHVPKRSAEELIVAEYLT